MSEALWSSDFRFEGRRVTVKKTGEGDKGRQFGYRAAFETTFTLKRSDFGMTGMTNVVGDEVTIMASIEGTK